MNFKCKPSGKRKRKTPEDYLPNNKHLTQEQIACNARIRRKIRLEKIALKKSEKKLISRQIDLDDYEGTKNYNHIESEGEDSAHSVNGADDEDEDLDDISINYISENACTKATTWNFGGPKYSCTFCNAIVWYEEKNRKDKNKKNPKFSICCQQGKVKLPLLKETPNALKQLMNYKGGTTSTKFRENIRMYNSMFAFTSMGGQVDHKINNGKGPYVFKINGENYHKIGSILPQNNEKPKFAQLYIYDTQNEVQNRLNTMSTTNMKKSLDSNIVQKIIDLLDEINPLVKTFRSARETYNRDNTQELHIKIIGTRTKDSRQYNLPTSTEIAGLVIGQTGEKDCNRDIILEHRAKGLQRITELHPSYMALQYPLLFPYAEDGYKTDILFSYLKNITPTSRNTISIREFYAFRIQQRRNEGWTLILGGRLYQQYIVDAYTAVEASRIRYVYGNQKTFRSDLYQNVKDAVLSGDTNAKNLGKRIILPATFTGGPRYMVQNYQDAIAICRAFGSPDLFITITCNPKWDEIQQFLQFIPGQKAEDRPDIVSRAFKIKLDNIIDDFRFGKHFGRVRAIIYTIEFQKRGLPHAHIVIFLHEDDKPNTPEKIDRFISAELPDRVKDPEGHKAVLEYMIHGPCGVQNLQCSCMENGKCTKDFPKKLSNETVKDKFGFYSHRRRRNRRKTMKNGIEIDNSWVVPHNLDLIVKYQCHINVEACNEGRTIKYLFKYMQKGNDKSKALIEVKKQTEKKTDDEIDEVKTYLDCRFISASEASWRLFGFNVQYRDPSVERLPFHLENEQHVTFRDEDDARDIVKKVTAKTSKFLEWMIKNRSDEKAKQLTYVEFPMHYVWKEKERKWSARKRGTSVGRIYYAHPTCGERYYLRMLLNHVKGPTCYSDIKTFENVEYREYKDACLARGLLEDDGEWQQAITEASEWSNASTLRQLFVTLLLFCEISRPDVLWNKNWESLADDVLYKRRKTTGNKHLMMEEDDIKNCALCEIEILLNKNNKSISDFKPLPLPDMSSYRDLENRLIQEELDYDCVQLKKEFEKLYEDLNEEQSKVFNVIIEAVNEDNGGLYFLYGSGGTGKTFLYKTILAKLRSEENIVLAVASSGIASLLLQGGRTAHSRFKIPLNCDEYTCCNIGKRSDLAKLIKRAKLIIWDEAPMNNKNIFETVDRTFRDIMDNKTKIFGGKTILLGGDFRQTLPIIQKGSRAEIVNSSISKSYLWDYCNLYTLHQNMRLSNKELQNTQKKSIDEFSKWVLDIGEGKIDSIANEDVEEPSWIKLPSDLIVQGYENPITAIIDSTYPDVVREYKNIDYLRDRCILSPTNDFVEELNEVILDRVPTQFKEYTSADSICPISGEINEEDILYPTEYLNTLKVSGIPNHSMKLKLGIPVIMMRNINPSSGLCNGTRLVLRKFEPTVIQAEIITGTHVGEKVAVHRIIMSSQPTQWPFILKRRQFPIRTCFAMSINKSQGQTLKHVGLFLTKPVFSHGQLYVAISRTTSKQGLKIVLDKNLTELKEYTKNIVYKEIFADIQTDSSKKTDTISQNTISIQEVFSQV